MKDYEPKIYLNNAATSWPKPDCVAGAMAEALENLPGDAGRGGIRDFHIFDQVRKELADLMNVSVKTVEHWESSRGTVYHRRGGESMAPRRQKFTLCSQFRIELEKSSGLL